MHSSLTGHEIKIYGYSCDVHNSSSSRHSTIATKVASRLKGKGYMNSAKLLTKVLPLTLPVLHAAGCLPGAMAYGV